MFISELESLDQSQCLINRSTDWQVIHRYLAEFALRVDDEQSTKLNIQ